MSFPRAAVPGAALVVVWPRRRRPPVLGVPCVPASVGWVRPWAPSRCILLGRLHPRPLLGPRTVLLRRA